MRLLCRISLSIARATSSHLGPTRGKASQDIVLEIFGCQCSYLYIFEAY
nr:MAG TPA: hypothetical protein [Caudoviricetes sp.]